METDNQEIMERKMLLSLVTFNQYTIANQLFLLCPLGILIIERKMLLSLV